MKFRKDFIGLDGFIWWVGVVENRQDPLGLGRCQVRVFGFHDKDLTTIPSEDLPWAQPIHALNNQTFSTPREGDYVFGFFLDGKFAQQPIMMGIIPGAPVVQYPTTDGFTDQRTDDLLAASPRKPAAVELNEDGSGAAVEEKEAAPRNPENIDEPTNSRLARNEDVSDTVIELRRKNILKDIPGANDITWDEPFPAYNAKYPFNKVFESESGHVLELDDTPKAERVHLAHRTGTFQEIYPSGTKVEKIVKNNYQIILSDDHLYVVGKVNITIESAANIKVVGDVNLQCENDINATVSGNMNLVVSEDLAIKAKNVDITAEEKLAVTSGDNFNLSSGSKMVIGSADNTSINAGSTFDVDSTLINLNKGTADIPDPAIDPGLTPPERGEPTEAEVFIEQTPADRAAYFLDAGEEGIEDYIQEQVDKGIYTPEQIEEGNNPTEGEKDETPPPDLGGTKDCEGVDKLTNFPDSLQLSQKFNLGQLSGKAPCGDPLKEQRGLTKAQIVCNLKLLAVNCLDKIKEKYPSALVTNAFRYPTGKAAGKSQHEIGQAADIQFPGVPKSGYYDIAVWIKANVPHDQLLLEYKTTGTGMPWIHISYKPDPRPPGPNKNMTVMNHRTHKPYFVNLA